MTTRTAMVILKTPAEIEQMRRAGVLAAEALREVVRAVRPGVTGTQLNAIAERYIRARGGRPSFLGYRGFPASICISVNDEVVHGIPDGMPLPDGALVSLDLGAVVDGFHGDVAVTVPVGQVEPRLHRLVVVTREALYRAIDVARPGKRLGDVGGALGGPRLRRPWHRAIAARGAADPELRGARDGDRVAGWHDPGDRTDGEPRHLRSGDGRGRVDGPNKGWPTLGALRAHRRRHRRWGDGPDGHPRRRHLTTPPPRIEGGGTAGGRGSASAV